MKKSKGSPYVPWYHGDFLRSTAGWTLMERATYWMLLCAQWESGALPTDMTRLAAIAGIDLVTMNAVWPVVGKKFTTSSSAGTLLNERLEEHHQNYLDYRRKQSEGGKTGMANRYGKGTKNTNVVEFTQVKDQPRG